jgi:Holliday junction DNA helicase RuvA
MIASLQGIVSHRFDPYLLITVSGVGYKVYAAYSVLQAVHVGEETTVFTYTHVREDILELYAFSAFADLSLFEQLISVSGIGPKTAMGVFALGNSSDIVSAIMSGDVAFFSSVPRLGKKMHKKLLLS